MHMTLLGLLLLNWLRLVRCEPSLSKQLAPFVSLALIHSASSLTSECHRLATILIGLASCALTLPILDSVQGVSSLRMLHGTIHESSRFEPSLLSSVGIFYADTDSCRSSVGIIPFDTLTDLCHPSFGTRRRLLMGFILIVVPSAGPTNTLIRTFNG